TYYCARIYDGYYLAWF
nr:immunoglobulin heavy chain junction region [Mus musculus]